MQKYTIFENTVYRKRLERRFFGYCLLRQLSLIRFLPVYLVWNLLYFFRIISREKYLSRRWSFLCLVKDPDIKLAKFIKRIRRSLTMPCEDVCVLSEHPRAVVAPIFEGRGNRVIANEYSLKQRAFPNFKRIKAFIPEGEYEAYGTLLSPIMGKAKLRHYQYGKKIYKSAVGYIAKTTLHYTFTYAIMTVYSVAIGLLSIFYAAKGHAKQTELLVSYFERPTLILLNIAPVIFLCWLLYFISNSPAFACFVSSGVVMVLTWINFYKLFFRNDPFLLGDIAIALEAKKMTESYKVVLIPSIIYIIIGIFIVGLIMAVYFRAPLRYGMARVLLIVAAVAVGVHSLNNIYLSSEVYSENANLDAINQWSSTDQFVSRGFVYPFLYSANTAFEKIPEGYDRERVENALSEYTYTDIPDDKKVNIISIMLESWGDLSKFDSVEFIDNPYTMLEDVYDDSYTGELINDIFSAGTVTTERQFLTGLTLPGQLRRSTDSVAWYFREQGYTVEGGHPSYDWFYNRRNINRNLGFEQYYFDDDHYMELNGGKRLADNDVMFEDIMTLFDEAMGRGENYFSFSVTYQGHGPYSSEPAYETPYIADKGYDEAVYHNVNNYLMKMEAVNEAIVWLADEVTQRDDPLVLILFGDHMPGLGENNSGYSALGINIDLSTEEGFKNYYSTPYVILANDAAKEVLGNDFVGEGPTVGPYFLMNEFFRLAGYTGDEYMQFTDSLYDMYQVYHLSGVHYMNGEIVMSSSQEYTDTVNWYRQVQYYKRNNFSY